MFPETQKTTGSSFYMKRQLDKVYQELSELPRVFKKSLFVSEHNESRKHIKKNPVGAVFYWHTTSTLPFIFFSPLLIYDRSDTRP